jgi:sugar lactone lactonase YvrE
MERFTKIKLASINDNNLTTINSKTSLNKANKMTKAIIFILLSVSIYFLINFSTSNEVQDDIPQEITYIEDSSSLIKPTLFADLGETNTTPDGLAIDKNGDLFLAITNATSYEKNGSRIMTFDENDKPVIWFDNFPLHPTTKRVHPMGMEFGPDGNLYFADNQFFAGVMHESRLIRIIVEDGVPVRSEVLVEGLNFGEAVRWYKEKVYVTDALFEDESESGIYSFSLKELNKNKIVLTNETKKKYLLTTFTLKPGATESAIGIDGMAIDKDGNLYAGSFGDGTIYKIELSEKGEVKSKKLVLDSELLNCTDGFYYDEKRNSIFIANYDNNSVHQLNLNTNTLKLIWVNGNADGSDGQLDNPCETIVYKGNLIVVNFDTSQGKKNFEVDKYHTISKFKLSQ